MTAGCRWQGDDLLLAVRVQPRASRDELLIDGDRLRARITAPPVEGAANAHLLRFLADEFGVNASRVRLVRGGTAREKVVRIASPGRLPAALAASLTALRNG
jgi:uncharacterized protein (TIGR00251 family)